MQVEDILITKLWALGASDHESCWEYKWERQHMNVRIHICSSSQFIDEMFCGSRILSVRTIVDKLFGQAPAYMPIRYFVGSILESNNTNRVMLQNWLRYELTEVDFDSLDPTWSMIINTINVPQDPNESHTRYMERYHENTEGVIYEMLKWRWFGEPVFKVKGQYS